MKKILLIISVLLLSHAYGQRKIDSLVGYWTLQDLYKDNLLLKYGRVCDNDFLRLKINKNKKLTYTFTNHKDSITFYGKIVFKKNNTIYFHHHIEEKVYLDSLERCVGPGLRMSVQRVFENAYSYKVTKDTLRFLYHLPSDTINTYKITFVRHNK